MRYNHAVTIAFEVWSNHPEGEDITPEMLKKALLKRIAQLDTTPDPKFAHCSESEWLEACLPPYDTEDMQEAA